MSLFFLYQYADHVNDDGKALSAYVRNQRDLYQQCRHTSFAEPEVIKFCSAPHLRRVYQAWLQRVNRLYLFQCPVCKDAPEVLIGDATSESIQARRYIGQAITQLLMIA